MEIKIKFVTNVFLLVRCIYFVTSTSDMTLDPVLLTKKIKEFLDEGAKRKELQDHIWDNLKNVNKDIDGEKELNLMVDIFSKRFQARIRAVQRLKNSVIKSFLAQNHQSNELCCFEFKAEYNFQFKGKVVTDRVCEMTAPTASNNYITLLDEFKDACIQNLKIVPSLKWQYFGSKQGVMTSFPASKECADFDTRFRPWYIEANAHESKQVVILIDKSTSMRRIYQGNSLMSMAIKTAKAIIDTLNPYDRVAVIAFANRPETLREATEGGGCFTKVLAQSTPQNKKKLSRYIDTLEAAGGSYYELAFDKAFTYLETAFEAHLLQFNTTDNFPGCTIHMISDGSPNDMTSYLLAAGRRKVQTFNRPIYLLTYGVGNFEFQVLKNLGNISIGKLQGGNFTRVTDPSLLREQLSDFYKKKYAQAPVSDNPIWSVPYLDWGGLGQIITGTLRVYVANEFVGVAAIDVTLEDLLAESTHFRPNEYSYAFVIDKLGLIVNHPLYPYLNNADALYVSATALEREPEFDAVFQSMRRGESGNKTFLATKVLPNGDSNKRGVIQHRVLSTYYWKAIPKTNFSVCIVLARNSTESQLASQGSLPRGSFFHHGLNFISPASPCVHLNSLASKDKSSVFFSWRAFEDPSYTLFHRTTRKKVEEIGQFMDGTGPILSEFKEGVKDEVVATQKAEELWVSTIYNEQLSQILWRFLSTKKGVYRIFPGVQLPEAFAPTERDWFQLAVASRGKDIITPPYIDAASGSQVISICSALFEERETGNDTENRKIFAVIGIDLLPTYFFSVLMEMYPVCSQQATFKCLLIDKAGFVIVTDEYATAQFAHPEVKHLTQIEPQITRVLIRDGVLERINCSNIATGLLQRSYKVKDSQSIYWGTYGHGSSHFFGFKFIPVPQTNSYLIIRTRTTSTCVNSLFCHCGNQASTKTGASSISTSSAQSTSFSTVASTSPRTNDASGSGDEDEQTMDLDHDASYLNDLIGEVSSLEQIPPDVSSTLGLCMATWEDSYCECPCASENPLFSSCLNDYSIVSQSAPPCTPLSKPVVHLEHLDDLTLLDKCYNTAFEKFIFVEKEFPTALVVALCLVGIIVTMAGVVLFNHPNVQAEIHKKAIQKREQQAQVVKFTNALRSARDGRRNSTYPNKALKRVDSAERHVMQRASLSN